MVYFDSKYLKQYLEQGAAIQIYVNDEYYDIADESDLKNLTYGLAYSLTGEPYVFDYRMIAHVKTGDNIVTRDSLSGTEGEAEDGGDDDIPSGEQRPPEGDESGEDTMPDAGDAFTPQTPPNAGMDTVPEPEIQSTPPEAGAEEEEELPPEPVTASRHLFGQMLTEAKKDTSSSGFVKGDLVENTDMYCEYVGSRGAVTNVDMPDSDDGVALVEYRVFNYGYNFKPGDKVTKLASQLRKIGDE